MSTIFYDKARNYYWLLPVVFFAMITRFLTLYYYQASELSICLGMDPQYFFSSAIRIYHGEVIEGHGLFVGGPLYPYFLAALMHLFGPDYFSLRLVQCLVGVVTATLIACIGKTLFSQKVGILAGIIYSMCGPIILSELGFENEFLVSFFTVIAFTLLICSRRSVMTIFSSGALLGLSALVRGNQVFAVGLTLVWLIVTTKPLRKALISCSILFLGVCAAVSLTTIRNYALYHELIPISAHGGYVFYLGNNPEATFRYTAPSFGDSTTEGEFPAAWNEANRRAEKKLTPNEVSSFWFREGLHFIINQPEKFISNAADKIRALANDYEVPDNYNYYFASGWVIPFRYLFVSFGLIFPLAFVGAASTKNRDRWILFVIPTTAFLTVLVFYYNSRFRITAFPFLVILASAGLFHLHELLRERKWKLLAVNLAATAVLAIIAFQPPLVADDYYVSYVLLAKRTERSNPNRAIQLYEKAISLRPQAPQAYVDLAGLYFSIGNVSAAKRELEPVAEYPEALVQLALIEVSQQKYIQAIEHLEKAVAIRPNYISAYKKLAILYEMAGRGKESQAILTRITQMEGY